MSSQNSSLASELYTLGLAGAVCSCTCLIPVSSPSNTCRQRSSQQGPGDVVVIHAGNVCGLFSSAPPSASSLCGSRRQVRSLPCRVWHPRGLLQRGELAVRSARSSVENTTFWRARSRTFTLLLSVCACLSMRSVELLQCSLPLSSTDCPGSGATSVPFSLHRGAPQAQPGISSKTF